MQKQFKALLQPDNEREAKAVGDDLYLLDNTTNPAIMIECGFLSNPDEAAKLESAPYQKQVAFTIMTGIKEYELSKK
jgi:N-acetylmuramoyl-L-alanine amidase